MISALFLLLLFLVSLIGLPDGHTLDNNILGGLPPNMVISAPNCSGCNLDLSSASEGLSAAKPGLLVSLPALSDGYRPHNTAIPGNIPLDMLISGSTCSGCYFDPLFAVEGLSMAKSSLSWTYSSSNDLTRPYKCVFKYQVMCQPSCNLLISEITLKSISALGQNFSFSFLSKYEPFFSINYFLPNFGPNSFRVNTLFDVNFFKGGISLPRVGCLFF